MKFVSGPARLTPALLLLVVGCSPPSEAPPDPLAEFSRIADQLTESDNEYLGREVIEEARTRLADPTLPAAEALGLRLRLAQDLLRQGDVDSALVEFDTAVAPLDLESRPDAAFFHRARGIIELRRAEVQNCVQRHNADCCIFPLRGEGVHVLREPALRAREAYLAALARDPGNLSDRWLLNVVVMALGEWPAGVPAEYVIPPSAFASDYDVGRFPDVAAEVGLDSFDLCGGAILEDFDGDGRLDVVSSTFDPRGPLKYFHNRGDGTFEDRAAASGLDQQLGGLNCLAADYDNDGRRDLLVLRGAWLHDDGRIRNSLLHNDPEGTFTDVTRDTDIAWPAAPTQAAVFGDFDLDGDLDLYVGNESRREMEPQGGRYPSQLFRNDGDDGFTDVGAEAGVTDGRYAKGVTAGDYDNDGDLDLYVSNTGPNRLYRNDGNLRFTDVAIAAGVVAPAGRSFATWFFDYDNDGWLDLFVASYEATLEQITAAALGTPNGGKTARLYRNRGDGTFEDVSERVGLTGIYLPMGANFGDLDHDGFLDIYLGTGEPDFRTLVPNVMLRNDGGRRFQDVTESGGFGHLQKGHGIAFGDLDEDGDQDVYAQLGGFYPGDRFRNALFRNPGHGNHFLYLDLEGVQTNRDAYGARIRIEIEEPDGSTREVHRAVGSVSSFGGSPRRQEIGLGRATKIRSVEITWPVSGFRHEITDAPLDSWLVVTEGREGWTPRSLRPMPLAGAEVTRRS
ncbi:MAG: FG-GAP-like repeat-containing protein [bacterium]